MSARRHLRAALRALALLAWTVLCWVAIEAGRALGRRRARPLRSRLTRAWARGVLRVAGGRVDVLGTPPDPPFLLVANHLSYADVPVLWCALPCRFLAKAEIARWPVVGLFARRAGTLFVRREARRDLPAALSTVRAALDAGETVVVFPEGTSGSGAAVMPFRPAFFEVAVETGAPVGCAAIGYETPPGEPPAWSSVCWWGGVPFARHAYGLLALEGFRATVAFGGEPLRSGDRKDLARRTHAAVSALFTPAGDPPPAG